MTQNKISKFKFQDYSKLFFWILKISISVIGSAKLAWTAPFPGTGGSALVSPQKGLFYAARGFHLKALDKWAIESGSEKKIPDSTEMNIRYLNPEFKNARLSVQTDTLRADTALETYTKKWMKDYSSYGFDVLSAKTFQAINSKGLVVDLHHKKKNIQIRQMIFVKNKNAVIVTCLDQPKTFNQSLAGCNQMARTFEWITSSARN